MFNQGADFCATNVTIKKLVDVEDAWKLAVIRSMVNALLQYAVKIMDICIAENVPICHVNSYIPIHALIRSMETNLVVEDLGYYVAGREIRHNRLVSIV